MDTEISEVSPSQARKRICDPSSWKRAVGKRKSEYNLYLKALFLTYVC